jgi:hypothetical protein
MYDRYSSQRAPTPAAHLPAFESFFLGGFECSSHRNRDGRRLDLLAATGHDRFVAADYRRLVGQGILAARDGMRWHLIEPLPGQYDWSSFLPALRAARDTGIRIIWDLCHYGWPDWLDIWSPDFPECFGRFAAAVASLILAESAGNAPPPVFCPVNEISFWAWAGGEVGRFNPTCEGQGAALKRQLVRATIAAIKAIRMVEPRARFITAEPIIHVVAGSGTEEDERFAENFRQLQFEALDMLAGTVAPELGGHPDFLDMVGVNFYSDNQWYLGGHTIPLGHHEHRPLSDMLEEIHHRYGRTVLIAETGAEGAGRAAWLHYVAGEVSAAMERNIPIEGICLYPILEYPGWENGRICQTGLWSTADAEGERRIYNRLAQELRQHQAAFSGINLPARRTGQLRARA